MRETDDQKSLKQKRKEEGRQRARQIAVERQKTKGSKSSPSLTPKPRTRHGARNQHRHKIFARWLLDRFPQLRRQGCSGRWKEDAPVVTATVRECDDRGTVEYKHVLDVACGKGELSARLAMCHSLSVVSVDPREADFAKCYEDLVVPKLPKKWQERIEGRREEDPQFVRREMNRRVSQMVTCFDDHSVENCEELQRAIEGSCLIIGLHADNATEAIVTAALEYRKPFVVVPCCVFPRLFCSRVIKGPDGREIPVRTHPQFCQYLLRKDPRLVMETLPFEGRNIAIWWDGDRSASNKY